MRIARPRAAARLAVVLLAVAPLGVAGPSTGAPQDLGPLVAPYLEAMERGAVAEVAGEASADSRTPTGSRQPLEGVSVMLLPESPALQAQLDALKRAWRDSVWSYVAAAEKLRTARADYEHALTMAGGGALVRGEVSDAGGRFRFAAVPAGRWLLLAWREAPHPRPPRRLREGEASRFMDNQERAGYSAVTYWRLALTIGGGAMLTVGLDDRNAWLTAVREDRLPPAAGPARAGPQRRQGTTR